MPPKLLRSNLLKWALGGAEARLSELRREMESIYASFPALRRRAGGRSPRTTRARKTGRRGWTAAQRKAAADRMRKYWAGRRNAKK